MSEAVAIAEFVARAIWKVLPAFLLSVALGVLIRALKLDGMIRRAVDARVGLAVVLATAVGAFSPLCSCTVIPVISGLLLSGVPLAPVMSFWVASPTMDPEMFALTVATLGWPLAIARLAATLVLSLGAGYLTLVLTRAGFFRGEIMRESLLPRRAPVPARLPLISAPVLEPVTVVSRLSSPRSAVTGGASAAPVPAGSCCAGSGSSVFARVTVAHSDVPTPSISDAGVATRGCCAETTPAPSVAPISGGSDGSTSSCCGGSPPPSLASSGRPSAASSCCGGSAAPAPPATLSSCDQTSAAGSCCGSALAETGPWSLGERLRAVHWPTFGRDMARETRRLGRWLVLAFVLEAVMLRYVPQAAVAGALGEGSHFAVVLAALVGIPLYLNNVSALPIVSGLLAQGMQPGAAVAFLIAGPVTTVPAMSAVWGIVKPRVFALYLGIALVGAVLLGTLTNLIL